MGQPVCPLWQQVLVGTQALPQTFWPPGHDPMHGPTGRHWLSHLWKFELHLKSQEVPSQVAVAFAGGAQGVQRLPQLATSVLETQFPLQSCLPLAHMALQGWAVAMQTPAQSLVSEGHCVPHLIPSQVALPPVGAGQGEAQAVPQFMRDLLSTQTGAQE